MRVYKYLPPHLASATLRAGPRLRLTQLSVLNDRFEGSGRFVGLFPEHTVTRILTDEGALGQILSQQIHDDLRPSLRRLWPLETFASIINFFPWAKEGNRQLVRFLNRLLSDLPKSDKPSFQETFEKEIRAQLERIGVISLSATPNSMQMWAYYGQSSTGFLLELEASDSFFQQRGGPGPLRLLRPVQYRDNLPPVAFLDTASESEQFRRAPERLFFYKLSSWKHEKEHRILFPLVEADQKELLPNGDSLYLKNIPPSAVTGVILGLNSSTVLRDELRQAVFDNAELRHVQLKRISISEKSHRLVLRPEEW